MVKNFVLDTNILLQNPQSIFGFDDNCVCVTIVTLDELDKKKNAPGDLGYNARESIRLIEEITQGTKDILSVSPLGNGTFRVLKDEQKRLLPESLGYDSPDHKIINITLGLKDSILITNDAVMRLKAKAAGLTTQTYHNDEIEHEDDYTGRCELSGGDYAFTENEFINDLTKGRIGWFRDGQIEYLTDEAFKNSYCIPRNLGQKFAMTALLSPDIPLVILKGPAGCAKTFLSLAAALEGFFKRDLYDKIVITRTNTLSDNDIGFLPGSLEDKMGPLVAPFFDNLITLLIHGEEQEDRKFVNDLIDDYITQGIIEIASMAYMRGRSLNNTFVIVDEAQNATKGQILEIITRAGIGTKIVLLGDPEQIDNNKLSKRNNGLVYASDKMKGSKLCATLTFPYEEIVRSALASEAAKRL